MGGMEDSGFECGKDEVRGAGGDHASRARGGIVTARGTGDGLVIRLDGRAECRHLRGALYDFVLSRKSFLAGNTVAFEWLSKEPAKEVIDELSLMLAEDFDVKVVSSFLQSKTDRKVNDSHDDSKESGLGLFGGMQGLEYMQTDGDEMEDFRAVREARTNPTAVTWDDPDARIVYATLRSGQKIETEHSLIVVGDVNSGAELIAGGDILVLGTLRGIAHAGAYDETGGGRFIFALSLQPTQLRIGMVISRGTKEGGDGAEIARVDGSVIVVERYHAKTALSKMKRF